MGVTVRSQPKNSLKKENPARVEKTLDLTVKTPALIAKDLMTKNTDLEKEEKAPAKEEKMARSQNGMVRSQPRVTVRSQPRVMVRSQPVKSQKVERSQPRNLPKKKRVTRKERKETRKEKRETRKERVKRKRRNPSPNSGNTERNTTEYPHNIL